MDQEILFTASKWDILRELSRSSQSPIQLAKKANTSVANVSQQLRLLELAGLVKSVRIPNRDKDKPRILYSLTKDTAFVIVASRNFAKKQFVDLDASASVALRAMCLPHKELRSAVQRAFWAVEQDLSKIQAILVVLDSDHHVVHVLSDDPGLGKKYALLKIPANGGFLKISVQKKENIAALNGRDVHVLYDPANLCSSIHATQEGNEVVS